MPEVYVIWGNGPYENTRAALSRMDLSPVCGKRVLLKPNTGRIAKSGSGIITDYRVVAAAIDLFREAGAFVAVGESPIMGVNVHEAFDTAGITRIAKERNCPLIDLDARPYVDVAVPEGCAIGSLKVCAEVCEYDITVSIPVMKMHMHTGVTLSVKNMKGCLWRRSKVGLHMLPPVMGDNEKPINIAIADMSGVLSPHLSIIDGTVGMEGLGPGAGEAKPFGVIVTGFDPFAVDAVGCRLMGIRAEEIPHLRLGAERGYGVINIDDIVVSPENWQDRITSFSRPPKNLKFEFPGITVFDTNSCSACQSTLLLFLKRYREKLFDYFPANKKINIAIGKGHKNLPKGTLCIGNCTLPFKNSGIFIQGCPPVGSEIIYTILSKPQNYRAAGKEKKTIEIRNKECVNR